MNNSNKDIDTRRVESELSANNEAQPPADLLAKLNTDLENAVHTRAWDGGADGADNGVPNVIAPTVSSHAAWWRSNNFRAAAAILVVAGATWIGVRQSEESRGEADMRPVTVIEPTIEPIVGDSPDLRTRESSVTSADHLAGDDSQRADGNTKEKPPAKLVEKFGYVAEPGRDVPGRQPPAKLAEEQARIGEKLESVAATSESPLLDRRNIRQGGQITQTELEKMPTARDPLAEMNRSPGTSVDRVNVAGEETGQRAEFRDRRAEAKTVDEVDVTDLRAKVDSMRAKANSPTYNDFDQFADREGERSSDARPIREAMEVAAAEPPRPREDHEKIFDVEDKAVEEEFDRIYRPRPEPPRRPISKFDAMFFTNYGISPFVDPRQDAESTFGLDADTGSYTVTRSYLNQGVLPPPEAVRVEEFLNAFNYGDAAPRRGEFDIKVEGATAPAKDWRGIEGESVNRAWLRVGVKAKEITAAERKPTALTFLIDTSGSMKQNNRLGLVKQSLNLLVNELDHRDTVAIATFGTGGSLMLAPTSDKNTIRRTIDELHPRGSTNLEAGMEIAYQVATRNLSADVNRRIILLSDGVANVGLTDPEGLLRNIAHWASRGVELTTVGVGMGNYNDALLERLADRGDGRYAYVDRLEEAQRLFVENLTGTLQTVAADARVQVTFDPRIVSRYRLVGYENRDIPDQHFRSQRTDAGEIGAGHEITALYELELTGAGRGRTKLGDVALVYRRPGHSELLETGRSISVGQVDDGFRGASPALRLAVLAARFAEILRVSPYVEGDLTSLFLEAQDLISAFPGDRKVVELTDLIGKARDLIPPATAGALTDQRF